MLSFLDICACQKPCSLEAIGYELTADFNTAHSEGSEPKVLPSADETEQTDATQTWPGLFWLPPADDQPAERDMLHLDDELAGLIEAADMPADQHGAHTTKPEPTSSVPGEDSVEQSQ